MVGGGCLWLAVAAFERLDRHDEISLPVVVVVPMTTLWLSTFVVVLNLEDDNDDTTFVASWVLVINCKKYCVCGDNIR